MIYHKCNISANVGTSGASAPFTLAISLLKFGHVKRAAEHCLQRVLASLDTRLY